MNIEDVRAYGLSLPHATERCPFGPDFLALDIAKPQTNFHQKSKSAWD